MANPTICLKSRRAVGGLISLIALLIVFGIASLAFLEINTTHADFVLNSIDVNEKQFGKIKEQLNFTVTNSSATDYYAIDVSNIWNDQSIVESHITIDSSSQISFQRYLNETTISDKQNVIDAEQKTTLNFDGTNSTHDDETIIFVTANGNKCMIPIPTEGDTLNRLC